MKILKKVLSLVLVVVMLIGIIPMNIINSNAITFEELNASKVFLKQEGKTTCTLCAATMMMRRYSMLRGDSDWYSITESAIKSNAWIDKQGLRYSFSYSNNSVSNINVGHYDLSSNMSEKEAKIQAELKNCPEGIVVYNRNLPHAVLLTDYTDGVYYCADPYSDSSSGRIPLDSSYGVRMSNITDYWKVTSPVVDGPTVEPSHVDIGTNFYALILNNEHWKIIENKNGVVQTANEIGNADQLWYFVRESDGSYRIYSCENGQCLDVYGAYSDSGTKIQTYPAHDTDAQRWYIYEQSGGYVLKPKCSDCVLDLPNNDPSNGNQLQIWTKNDTGAQIWAIYRNDSILLKAPNMTINAGTSITPTTFYWDDVRGEKRYDVKIYRDYIDVSNEYHIEWGATSGYSIILPAGKYQAYVDSTHEFDCKRSNVIEFTVEPSYRIAHWFGFFENGEGNNGDKDQILFVEDKYSSYSGNTITLGETKVLTTIPNGFYNTKRFGTGNIDGVWAGYNFGTVDSVVQGKDDMYFEYYYRPYEYTITYNLNGGTNSSSNPATYNVLYGFTLENPTREGYTFAGWTDADGNKVTGINPGKNASFATNATYEQFCQELAGRTTGDQILTANWIADYCTITYDANGGIGAPESQKKDTDEIITLSNTIPIRTGYTFLGWATDKNATVPEYLPGGEFNVNADTTLYAVWSLGCTGEHNYEPVITAPTCIEQGYTTYTCINCGDTYVSDYVDTVPHEYASVVTAPTCTEQGFTTFSCGCGDTYVTDYTDAKGHLVIDEYCLRCGSYIEGVEDDIIFGDLDNNGMLNAMDMNIFKRVLVGSFNVTEEQFASADIDRNGKINAFDSYLLIVTMAGKVGACVVSLDPNGGMVEITALNVYRGQPYGELPTPTRTGYTFIGWYTEASGGTRVDAETVVSSLTNQTLYAHWEALAYTVNWNNGTGYTVTVDRTSSPYADASIGTLTNGDVIYYGDVLSVTYTKSDYYKLDTTGDTTITVTGNVTSSNIYATASLNPISEWVKASEMPSEAQIIESRWTYTEREYTSDSSSSLSGWTHYNTERTGWTSWSGWSTWNPDNGVRNVEWRSQYDHTEYHYYRWTNSSHTNVYTSWQSNATILEEVWFDYELPKASGYNSICYNGTDNWANRWVRADYAGNRDTDKTFTRDIYRDEWRYQDPIYTYYFYRDVSKVTTAADPTGQNNVSNVVKYVKYREK